MTAWSYLEGKVIPAGTLPIQLFVNREHALRFNLPLDKVYTLNELGEEGWNLIQVIQLPTETRFIFRRPSK